MSGIVGIYSKGPNISADVAVKMLSVMRHRGPHSQRVIEGENATLGKCWLPLEEGEQKDGPVYNNNEAKAIVFDGEIYNLGELKKDLLIPSWSDHHDLQIFLKLYEQSGPRFVSQLKGTFSLIIWDGDAIYATRDYLGVRPLYYGTKGNAIFLASEMKALLNVTDTFQEFPPGHYFHSGNGFVPYHRFPNPSLRSDVAILIKEIRRNLEVSVTRRLNSKASTGVLLSGGIDSSIVAALVNQKISHVPSFSVGMEGGEDLSFAKTVSNHLGTTHHEYIYNLDQVLEILPDVIYHLESYEAPTVRSSIANYFASRMAKGRVQVLLIGEGGDENFGGYHHLKGIKNPHELHNALIHLLSALHNVGCQRVDRMNAAHSLTVKVPFLDQQVVYHALSVDPSLKIYGEDQIEKWILRKAFEADLPPEVVWRPKKQFARGSGSDDLLTKYADNHISDTLYEKERGRNPEATIRCKEELMYYQIFKKHFNHPSAVKTVGLWEE